MLVASRSQGRARNPAFALQQLLQPVADHLNWQTVVAVPQDPNTPLCEADTFGPVPNSEASLSASKSTAK